MKPEANVFDPLHHQTLQSVALDRHLQALLADKQPYRPQWPSSQPHQNGSIAQFSSFRPPASVIAHNVYYVKCDVLFPVTTY